MSSGQHLTKEMYDLVKSIGETRSKQEEDKIITAEVSSLKSKINDKNTPPKRQKENLIRAIYIEMLGQDATFAHIHAVNMTQSKVFSLKRMGYLACSLFFNENSELLLLLVAALQKDLASSNVNEVQVALNTVSKLICGSIVHALVDPILLLLNHASEAIRKKAVLCVQKIYEISPSLISSYTDKMKRALCDKDPSVMGTVLHLYFNETKKNPALFKDLTGSFVVILKQIIEHKLARDYDYHRMPAPWIQIRILQILALLGENDQKVSEQIYEILSQTLKRADDTGINIGYAVTYQCVKTISTIYPNQNLLETAGKSISRFLVSENNNLKYLGINALIPIVQINPKYSIEHQMTVVDCLESPDETLKRETLLLLFKMTNGNNVEVIVEKLLHYLKMASDPHFKKDLVNKIMQLSERLAPSQEWFINTMNSLFEFGSEYITEEILTNVLKLIEESFKMSPEEVGEYLIQTYNEIILKEDLPDVMIKVVSWVFGEIGSEIYSEDPDRLNDLYTILSKCLSFQYEDEITKAWIINALAKLSSCSVFPSHASLDELVALYSRSKFPEVCQRASEYRYLKKYRWALKQSSQLNSESVDPSLSFLNSYVQKAKDKGAKLYDSKKNTSNWLNSLGIDIKEPVSQLSIHPYSDKKSQVNSNNPIAKQDDENQSKISWKGPKKWTPQGYEEEQPVNKPAPIGIITQSMSSNPQTGVKKTGNSISGPQISSSKMQGISSENYMGPGPSKQEPKPNIPKPALEKKMDDAAIQEKAKLASQLFDGFAGASKKEGLFNNMKKPNVSNVPVSIPKKNDKKNIDLLDLDEEPPKKNNNLLNILGNVNVVAPSSQKKNMPFSKPKVKVDLGRFESLWESLPTELIETFQSLIKSELDFKNMCLDLGIEIIEIINNEIICAGETERKEVFLLYGIYELSGSLEIRIKAKTQEEMKEIMKIVKLFAL